MTERESRAVTTAVWVGSLVLVGGPAAALVWSGASFGLSLLPVRVGDPWLGIAGGVVALAIGLVTATEVAFVRLHGWAVLQRGTLRRRLLRHGVLAIPSLVLLASFVRIAAELFVYAPAGSAVGVLAALATTVVVLFVLVRVARAFLAGRREALDSGEARIASRVLRK